MKLLLDQDVYALTERFLRDLGCDIVTAVKLGLSRSTDSALLKAAGEQKRKFVTRDKDYGNLVFVHHEGSGVIYLRILPSTIDDVHTELKKVLETYSEAVLATSFVVVEKGRHRIRKIE